MVSGSFELRIAAHSRGVEKLYHESAQNATKKRPHAQTSAAFESAGQFPLNSFFWLCIYTLNTSPTQMYSISTELPPAE